MSFEFWFTSILLVAMTVVLVREWVDIEVVVSSVLILLIIGEVVTPQEAFSGFSNVGLLSIAVLYVVAGSIKSTGLLSQLNNLIYGKNKTSLTRKLFRLLFPVTFFSSFMNNTPLVAMLIPSVRDWAKRNNYASSRFLLPISYAAIFGGLCTLIGTSTNLIVHGLLIQNGFQGFSFFEISRIGVPAAVVGLIYVSVFAGRMLPERKEAIVDLEETTRKFVSELKVTEEYDGVGKTIEEAGLRHLQGLFLFQIERDDQVIAPAEPEEELKVNDRLFFTGIPETIMDLQKIPGLHLTKDVTFDLKHFDSSRVKTFEAVISRNSPLVGMNVRESNFRGRYDAVIIAIHRSGKRIEKKIGDIVLETGDTLLLLAHLEFFERWYHSGDFYLVSAPSTMDSMPRKNQYIAGISVLGMIVLTVLNILPLIAAAGLAAILLILTKTVSRSDAKSMIDWKVLLVIGAAFGIGVGIQKSGVAAVLASQLMELKTFLGPFGVLCGVYLLTSLYNTIISSNATAALFFPVAMTSAAAIGADVRPFALAVTISAAASFASPISYQTNLMVYGPGGYKFSDYLRFGIPLQLIIGIIAVALIYYYYF